MSARALRTYLSDTSILLATRPTPNEDWYSSSDTERLAKELETDHSTVTSWASGSLLPTREQALALQTVTKIPVSSWPDVAAPTPKRRASIAAAPSAARCECPSHLISYTAPDYETLPLDTRRFLVRRIATAIRSTVICEERKLTAGVHEQQDLAFVLSDWPDDVPFFEWETEAWARVALLESATPYEYRFQPDALKVYLESDQRSIPHFAKRLGVNPDAVRGWISGDAKPTIEHACKIRELGGPHYLHWLEPCSPGDHRAPPKLNWSTTAIEHIRLSPRLKKPPAGKYRPSRGMYQLRSFMTALDMTLGSFSRWLDVSRSQAFGWMAGTSTPTLQTAWRIYIKGGPPIRAWLVDTTMSMSPDESTMISAQELQQIAEVKAQNDVIAELERYKEEARWAVSRPVLPAGKRPSDEETQGYVATYHARLNAANALLRSRPGALEEWKATWAGETINGKWTAPWEKK